jgi:hypothetical protein
MDILIWSTLFVIFMFLHLAAAGWYKPDNPAMVIWRKENGKLIKPLALIAALFMFINLMFSILD